MPSKTEPMLTREILYHYVDCKTVKGTPSGLTGNVTDLRGDVGKIPPSERPANISDYVKK